MGVEPGWSVDEDGFFALVVPQAYDGFVGEDWTLQEVVAVLVREAARGVLAIVHVGPDLADSPVEVRSAPSGAVAVDEVVRVLEVPAGGGPSVTTWAELTMAAQYADEPVRGTGRQLSLPPGRHRVLLRRLRDDGTEDGGRRGLEVVVGPATGDEPAVPDGGGVPWLDR